MSTVRSIEERFLSATEIAKRQGISSSTVRRRIKRFPGAIFDGFSWRIPEAGYAAYLEDCQKREPARGLPLDLRKNVIDVDRAFSGAVRAMRDRLCGVGTGKRGAR